MSVEITCDGCEGAFRDHSEMYCSDCCEDCDCSSSCDCKDAPSLADGLHDWILSNRIDLTTTEIDLLTAVCDHMRSRRGVFVSPA